MDLITCILSKVLHTHVNINEIYEYSYSCNNLGTVIEKLKTIEEVCPYDYNSHLR